jgi:hypothetical protein
VVDPLDTSLVCDLLERCPTLEQLQSQPAAAVLSSSSLPASEVNRHTNLRDRHSKPGAEGSAIVEVQASVVPALIQVLRTLRSGIEKLDWQMGAAAAEHPDYHLYQSGAEPLMAPRLLAMGTLRDRYRSAQELQAFSDIAPVMEQSDKSNWVHSRWRCPKFLRQSFHEWAGHSIRFCPCAPIAATTNPWQRTSCRHAQPDCVPLQRDSLPSTRWPAVS